MRRGEEGFTLVEILVAALLIGIGLVPLLQLYPQTLESNLESEYDLILSAATVRKMEELIPLLRSASPPTSGDATCTDLPSCRLVWTIATELSSGITGVGRLSTVQIVACQDMNNNSACDAAERQVRYDAKTTSRP